MLAALSHSDLSTLLCVLLVFVAIICFLVAD